MQIGLTGTQEVYLETCKIQRLFFHLGLCRIGSTPACAWSYNAIKSKYTAFALLLPIVNLGHQIKCFIYPSDIFGLVYMGKIPSQTLMNGRPLKK